MKFIWLQWLKTITTSSICVLSNVSGRSSWEHWTDGPCALAAVQQLANTHTRKTTSACLRISNLQPRCHCHKVQKSKPASAAEADCPHLVEYLLVHGFADLDLRNPCRPAVIPGWTDRHVLTSDYTTNNCKPRMHRGHKQTHIFTCTCAIMVTLEDGRFNFLT